MQGLAYYGLSSRSPLAEPLNAHSIHPWAAESDEFGRLLIFWSLDSYDTDIEWSELAVRLSELSDATLDILDILVVLPFQSPDQCERIAGGSSPRRLLRSLHADQDAAGSAPGWISYEELPAVLDQPEGRFLSWSPRPKPSESHLVRYCRCMASLTKSEGELPLEPFLIGWDEKTDDDVLQTGSSAIGPSELHRFLADPTGFATRELHGASAYVASPDGRPSQLEGKWTRKLEVLELLAGRLNVPRNLPLNILVVDNDIDGLKDWVKLANRVFARDAGPLQDEWPGCYSLSWLRDANWFLLSKQTEFDQLLRGEWPSQAGVWQFDKDGNPQLEGTCEVPWGSLDLILQDIMLDPRDSEPTGLEIVPHYLEHCPQSLVFALTGMDVESLIRSGDPAWQQLDAVIPKRRLGSLWWQYYRAFRRRFGRSFWRSWLAADDGPGFGCRQSLRQLFSNLRRWSLEPAILTQGQGVQEMIDHGHRHITALWRLTDDTVGTLLENSSPGLPTRDLMVFAMAVWLHDIGHRGNEFTDDPADVRAWHGGISEYLLLKNPSAFGLDWLLKNSPCITDLPDDPSHWSPPEPKDHPLLKCRNSLECTTEERTGPELCPIRKVGLLCRHHQSNAPLDITSLEKMSEKGKTPSPYSRVRFPPRKPLDAQQDLEDWLSTSKSLEGWYGSEIRCLNDFTLGEGHLLPLAGLLRMLDAIQLHRSRVGTTTSIESFNAFLAERSRWCRRKLAEVERVLAITTPGTESYQSLLARFFALRQYERLVNVQHVHYWRQLAVREADARWSWDQDNGSATVTILLTLDPMGLSHLEKIRAFQQTPQVEEISLLETLRNQVDGLAREKDHEDWIRHPNRALLGHPSSETFRIWAMHVRDDVILSEHKSQEILSEEKAHELGENHRQLYLRCFPESVAFRIAAQKPAAVARSQKIRLLDEDDVA